MKRLKHLGKLLKSFAVNGLIVCVSLVLSAFLGELLVRWLSPQKLVDLHPDIWTADEPLGWRLRENLSTTVNTGAGTVHLVTDSRGYRINRDGTGGNDDTAELSILIIGDSFVEALQVENEDTLGEGLRRLLEDKYGLVVHVANSGVRNWNPNHYLLQSRRALSRQSFDLGIVLLYVANDCIQETRSSYKARSIATPHRFRMPRSFRKPEWVEGVFYPFNDLLETRSHLFVFLKNRSRVLLARVGLTPYYFPPIFYRDRRDSPKWTVTAQVAEEISKEFEQANTPVIFALIPAPYQVHEEQFYEYVRMFDIPVDAVDLEQPNERLKKSFGAVGIELLDPLNRFRTSAEAGNRLYGTIDKHFSPAGHAAMAAYLFPLAEAKLANKLLPSETAALR